MEEESSFFGEFVEGRGVLRGDEIRSHSVPDDYDDVLGNALWLFGLNRKLGDQEKRSSRTKQVTLHSPPLERGGLGFARYEWVSLV